MKNIVNLTLKFDTEIDRELLEEISDKILLQFYSIESALSSVGVDSRYYQHWIKEAKHGNEEYRALVIYLHSLLEQRKSNLKSKIYNSRDMKAILGLLQLEDEKEYPTIDATDNSTLYISDDDQWRD